MIEFLEEFTIFMTEFIESLMALWIMIGTTLVGRIILFTTLILVFIKIASLLIQKTTE